jgi:hypothetical protein
MQPPVAVCLAPLCRPRASPPACAAPCSPMAPPTPRRPPRTRSRCCAALGMQTAPGVRARHMGCSVQHPPCATPHGRTSCHAHSPAAQAGVPSQAPLRPFLPQAGSIRRPLHGPQQKTRVLFTPAAPRAVLVPAPPARQTLPHTETRAVPLRALPLVNDSVHWRVRQDGEALEPGNKPEPAGGVLALLPHGPAAAWASGRMGKQPNGPAGAWAGGCMRLLPPHLASLKACMQVWWCARALPHALHEHLEHLLAVAFSRPLKRSPWPKTLPLRTASAARTPAPARTSCCRWLSAPDDPSPHRRWPRMTRPCGTARSSPSSTCWSRAAGTRRCGAGGEECGGAHVGVRVRV